LGKNGEKLETIERQETREKGDNEDNPGRRRGQEGKIRDMRVD